MQGLNKDKDKSDKRPDAKISNSFWVYSIATNKWTCYYQNENSSPDYWNMMQHLEPRPRYAHQLAYDEVNRVRKIDTFCLHSRLDWNFSHRFTSCSAETQAASRARRTS